MKPPSIHVRAFLTWLAIFPLVLLCFVTVLPLMNEAPTVLRVVVLTLIVVPSAVYVVVPNLMRIYLRLTAKK